MSRPTRRKKLFNLDNAPRSNNRRNANNNAYGKCIECSDYNISATWCQSCGPRTLTQGWSSENNEIDEIIKSTQLQATEYDNFHYLQWIPYEDLKDIERIGEGGFATIYKARWVNGEKYIDYLDGNKRCCRDRIVAIKILHDSQELSTNFLNEFRNYVKFHNDLTIIHIYGMSRVPDTKEYVFVMDFLENGALHSYLKREFDNLSWKSKIGILRRIISGLDSIHKERIIHHDLHSGNILQKKDIYGEFTYISDLGLSCPANEASSDHNNFGVLPYVAPEIFKGKPYTTASDIYSFGVLMSLISTGQQPYPNIPHDQDLAIKICDGERPAFSHNTPSFYIKLAHMCMNNDPKKRPTAKEVKDIISYWDYGFTLGLRTSDVTQSRYSIKELNELKAIRRKFEDMDKKEDKFHPSLEPVSPGAIYTSRCMHFDNQSLPPSSCSTRVVIIGNHDSHEIELVLEDNVNTSDFIYRGVNCES